MRVLAGDDEEPARLGIDHRRSADSVAPGCEVRRPHGLAGRLVERDHVGVRAERGEGEEEAATCRPVRGLATRRGRRAAGVRRPFAKVEHGCRTLILEGPVRRERRVAVERHIRGHRLRRGDREIRCGERRPSVDVVAALEHRRRTGSARAAGARRAARVRRTARARAGSAASSRARRPAVVRARRAARARRRPAVRLRRAASARARDGPGRRRAAAAAARCPRRTAAASPFRTRVRRVRLRATRAERQHGHEKKRGMESSRR